MDQIVTEDIIQLRQKLKLIASQNQTLKQQLNMMLDTFESHAKKLKSSSKDHCFAQKLLHSYAGVNVTVNGSSLEVSIRPWYSGEQHSEYKILLERISKRSWEVSGYNMPPSVYKEPRTSLSSKKQLADFIRELSKEVQAYAARKYQATKVEEIFKKTEYSIWYSTKFQIIVLTAPLTVLASDTKFVGIITLHYKSDHILPFEVTAEAKGLNADKLEKLRTRFEELLMHCPLLTVIEEEFFESHEEGSESSSNLTSRTP